MNQCISSAIEEICLPITESISGLKVNDSRLGYSPERINPEIKIVFSDIVKVISGWNDFSNLVDELKNHSAGTHRAQQ